LGSAAAAGSSTVKVDPSPSPGLSAAIEPPWSSTRCLATASPDAEARVRRVVALSSWRKRSEDVGEEIPPDPAAVSSTWIWKNSALRERRIVTRPAPE
jgi:hypothetical protein